MCPTKSGNRLFIKFSYFDGKWISKCVCGRFDGAAVVLSAERILLYKMNLHNLHFALQVFTKIIQQQKVTL